MAKRFIDNTFRVDLSKVPEYKPLKGVFYNQIDAQLVQLFLEDDKVRSEHKVILAQMQKCVKNNRLPVKYSARHGLGRRYPLIPEGALLPSGKRNRDYGIYHGALITLPRTIKNTVFAHHGWVDLDQVKGHPTILLELARRANLRLDAYEEYLRPGRFDDLCTEIAAWHNIDGADAENCIGKGEIKQLFNRTIYTGSFEGWVHEMTSGERVTAKGEPAPTEAPKFLKNQEQPHPFYARFAADTNVMVDRIYGANPDLAERTCADLPLDMAEGTPEHKERLRARKARVMSYVCQIVENDVTFEAFRFLCTKRVIQNNVLDWGYDGLTFPRPEDPSFNLDRRATGFQMVSFVHKQFGGEVRMDLIERRRGMPDLTDEEAEEWKPAMVVEDERDASKVIYDMVKDRVVHTRGATYLRQGESRYWVSDPAALQAHLTLLIADTPFQLPAGEDGKTSAVAFGGSMKRCKAILGFVMAEITAHPDEEFYDRFHDTTRGRTGFRDGVYDWGSGRFSTWQQLDYDYDTCVVIPEDGAEIFAATKGRWSSSGPPSSTRSLARSVTSPWPCLRVTSPATGKTRRLVRTLATVTVEKAFCNACWSTRSGRTLPRSMSRISCASGRPKRTTPRTRLGPCRWSLRASRSGRRTAVARQARSTTAT